MGERFWTGVALAGCIAVGLAIAFFALPFFFRSLASGLIAVGVTALLLASIYLLNRPKRR